MSIIKYPLSTEKAIREMETRNTLVFVVDKKAKKPEIKAEIERMFKVKIVGVNVMNDQKGRKKAFVVFSPENPAIDTATKLGLM